MFFKNSKCEIRIAHKTQNMMRISKSLTNCILVFSAGNKESPELQLRFCLWHGSFCSNIEEISLTRALLAASIMCTSGDGQ
jgi:hypothetical protein